MGCINVHFSLLPKYRGAAPVNWAIVAGERETGVTTMLMDEGLDTGAMLLQERTAIGARETAPELTARLALMGAELLSRTLQTLPTIQPREQDPNLATFAPILKREDGRIDWLLPAAHIERMTRGFQPFPGAHTTHDGRRLIIMEAEVVEKSVADVSRLTDEAERTIEAGQINEAGQIVEASGERLVVTCGAGSRLRLVAVQPEGKRRMSARDWMNGARVVTGACLV
jgi:methionyl-tRNA formyltransferase